MIIIVAWKLSIQVYFKFLGEFNCTEEVLTISAMLQVQNVFLASPGRKLELVCMVVFFLLKKYIQIDKWFFKYYIDEKMFF